MALACQRAPLGGTIGAALARRDQVDRGQSPVQDLTIVMKTGVGSASSPQRPPAMTTLIKTDPGVTMPDAGPGGLAPTRGRHTSSKDGGMRDDLTLIDEGRLGYDYVDSPRRKGQVRELPTHARVPDRVRSS